ncbi:MAG TPA: ABC transporter permease [Bryobacteraceae bacterium]|jgi:predicted permease|nr:ABC transporter permease [Bryobacteraceae bacterium]
MNRLDELVQNLRFSARTLRRSPMFTTIAVVSLALGIGANTAIFSFVRGIVLKELPVAGADRLSIIRQSNEQFHMENCCFQFGFYRELRPEARDFEDLVALTTPTIRFSDRDQIERLEAEVVSGNYFRVMGVKPALGRLLDENDDAAEDASPVVVISHRLWIERYAGDRGVIGRGVKLDGNAFQIVGVTEQGFAGSSLHHARDLQVPSSMVGKFFGMKREAFGWAQIIGKRKPGVSVAQAEASLSVVARRIYTSRGFLMSPRDRFLLRDGSQGLNSSKEQFGKPVLVLMLLVAVVLLVACANLAALLLVRSVERGREAGVRLALGASRGALVRRFLTESLLIAAVGGAAGWWLARGMTQVLLGMLGQQGAGLAQHVVPDATVFAFSAAVTILAGLLFGTLPAWRTSHADPIQAIHGVSSSSPRRQSFASRGLMAAQIALSLTLVFGAGLFSKTLANLRAIDLGFRPENVAMLRVDLSQTTHAGKAAEPFFTELIRRIREMPETRSASFSDFSLLSGAMTGITVKVPGFVPANRMAPVVNMMRVSAGFFRTHGIPLVAGRDFIPEDHAPEDSGVIVNQQFARQFFGGEALGKNFSFGGNIKVHVVGVVATAKYQTVREEPKPVMYRAVTERNYPESLMLEVRTANDTPAMLERLRATVRDLDRSVPVRELTTMALQIDESLSRERLLSFLSMLLGGLALTLAAIGLYGVLSFSVVRRTREIGIRMAIGARRGEVLGMFLRESAWIVAAGVAMGIPLALGGGKLASSLLYGLEGQDVRTAAIATGVLTIVALAAALIPAARAARVDPLIALRHE